MRRIKAEFIEYKKVTHIVGEQRIEERLSALHEIYERFCKEMHCEDDKDIRLNDRTLIHIILDYFTDIIRLKEFHDIKKINEDKIIAYECSWILRRKPIQVMQDQREELIYVNEKFVLGILVNHLTNNKIDSLEESENLKIFCDILLYYLKYRNCDAKVLEMIIISFKVGNSIKKVN